MPKRNAALAGALSLLLLAACGSREGESADVNTAAAAPEANAIGTTAPSDPAQPNLPANDSAGPVPPPDAVSHPNGYLPPEPDPPGANSSGPDSSPPATEDEYLRNRQSGR